MSFRLKIFAALLAAQLVLVTVFTTVGTMVIEDKARQIGKEQGIANALLLARTLAEPVSFFDLARIDEFLVALSADPLVHSATVFSRTGGLLATSADPATNPSVDPDVFRRVEVGETIYRGAAGRNSFLVPIHSNDILVGALDLQIGNPAVAASIAKARSLGGIAVVLGVLAALALAFLFSRHLSRRLAVLRRTSEALGNGDFSARAVLDGSDELSVLARSFNGMAERIETAQATLQAKVRTDYLTGIPNRIAFEERLNGLMSDPRALPARILHIDLDRFKEANDNLGHSMADRVLKQVSDRLQTAFATTFDPEKSAVPGFVGRIGGDEFIGIMPEIGDAATLNFAQDLLAGVSHPIIIGADAYRFSASVGIASITPDASTDVEDILNQADIALYEAKRTGGNKVILIDDRLREQARARTTLMKDVERGLDAGEFHPYLQPQIDLKTGAIVGFEMLARWIHPERGIVAPGGFIALLNGSPLVTRIDHAIQKVALSWLGQARKVRPELQQCRIGLNITELQLGSSSFVTELLWRIDAVDLEPQNIAIEVLENVLVEQGSDRIHANLHELARRGFAIELDDFGTGHSAISNLMTFSVNRIKIDRSFITHVDRDQKKQTLVSALVSAGRAFGVSILAEGVETPEEMQTALSLGCDEAQGYVIGRPMSLTALEDWIDARKSNVA